MKETLAIAGVVVLAGVIVYSLVRLNRWDTKRRVDKIFAGRDGLDEHSFHERYFAELGVSPGVSAGVRGALAESLTDVPALGGDLSRLSDTDEFAGNLSFLMELDSLAQIAFVMLLEKNFGIEITDAEAQSARSIRDVVLLVDRKMKSSSA